MKQAFGTACDVLAAFLVTFVTPYLLPTMGVNIGWIFGSVALFASIWGFFFFPELKVSRSSCYGFSLMARCSCEVGADSDHSVARSRRSMSSSRPTYPPGNSPSTRPMALAVFLPHWKMKAPSVRRDTSKKLMTRGSKQSKVHKLFFQQTCISYFQGIFVLFPNSTCAWNK